MRINARGQVTIPWRIRELLALEPGTEVEVFVAGDSVVLRRKQEEPAADIGDMEFLSDQARALLTPDEILALAGETP